MENPIFHKTKQLGITVIEVCEIYNMQRQHYHDTYEVYLQLDGERTLFFDNEKYLLTRGSLFVINPFVLHITGSAESVYYKRYVTNFSQLALSSILSSSEADQLLSGLHSCVINLTEEQLRQAEFYFNQLNDYVNNETSKSEKLRQMSLALLIDFLSSIIKSPKAITLLDSGKKTQTPIYTAIAYVNSNYEHEITLDFISSYVHMSKSNFCLVFKKIIGETFIDYLNTVRITQAHKLLSSTDLSLKEIARRVGFSSSDYMAKIFKKIHSASPSSFRKKR